MKQGVLLTPAATATQLISGAQKPAVLLCQLLRLGHHAGSFSRLGSDDQPASKIDFQLWPATQFPSLGPHEAHQLTALDGEGLSHGDDTPLELQAEATPLGVVKGISCLISRLCCSFWWVAQLQHGLDFAEALVSALGTQHRHGNPGVARSGLDIDRHEHELACQVNTRKTQLQTCARSVPLNCLRRHREVKDFS